MITPAEALTVSIVVLVVHELSHLISSLGRVKGVVAGVVEKKWKIGIGFIVHPLRLRDILLPQVIVPAVLLAVFRDPLIVMIGVLMNVGSGVHDISLIPKLQRINGKTEEDVRREVLERVRGFIWWIR
ncbi:MAG: hypothetical protein QXM08_00465 [Thermofilaceae archaeon]